MNNATDNTKVTFQIKDVNMVELHIIQLKKTLPISTTFHFEISLTTIIITEESEVIVEAKVVILHEDNTTILASIKVDCVFEVANFREFISKDTGQLAFPKSAIITFNSITLSTVRGMMLSKFKGTHLDKAILPVSDPYSFHRFEIRMQDVYNKVVTTGSLVDMNASVYHSA